MDDCPGPGLQVLDIISNLFFRQLSKILDIWRHLHVTQKHLYRYFIFMILIKFNQMIGFKNFQKYEIQNGMLILLGYLSKERDPWTAGPIRSVHQSDSRTRFYPFES